MMKSGAFFFATGLGPLDLVHKRVKCSNVDIFKKKIRMTNVCVGSKNHNVGSDDITNDNVQCNYEAMHDAMH